MNRALSAALVAAVIGFANVAFACPFQMPAGSNPVEFYCGGWYVASSDESHATMWQMFQVHRSNGQVQFNNWMSRDQGTPKQVTLSGNEIRYDTSNGYIKLVPDGKGNFVGEFYRQMSDSSSYYRAILRPMAANTTQTAERP